MLDPRKDATPAASRIAADLDRRSRNHTSCHDVQNVRFWQSKPSDVRTSGPLTIVGHFSLTDLSDLRTSLEVGPDSDSTDLVLAAWLRWGVDAPHHLNGAFAFVIWDQRSNRLTAVRDRFGVQPLSYSVRPDRAILAPDLSTVVAGLDVVPDTNPVWVADFLAGAPTDMSSTAWSGVHRLPPGHLMNLDQDGTVDLWAWYRLQASSPPTDVDVGQALRAALTHATAQACVQEPTATMLSGGLDSSTLSLMSLGHGDDTRPRPALSLRFQDPDQDEGRYIEDVLNASGDRLTAVSLAGETSDEDLFNLDAQFDWQDQPFFAPGINRHHKLYRAARDLGYGAIIDGHGGDEVISGTFYDIALSAKGRHWPQALRLTIQHARFTGIPVTEAVASLLAARGKRGFGRLGRKIMASLNTDEPTALSWFSLVDPDLARETDIFERSRQMHRPDPRDRDLPQSVRLHIADMAGPISAIAFETLNRAAQIEGIRPHYPFYDHRVAELCVWQTANTKVAFGRPRALLREATKGLLPESIRLRRDKTDFMRGFWFALQRDPDGRIAALLDNSGPLQGWANAATLREDVKCVQTSVDPEPQTAFRIWRALSLAAWLDRGTVRNLPVSRPASVSESVR
ncbi:asparagine synthase-related protein [Paracoccus sp. JM45]|uniref:asparagine synthase-related protein n=1 Tax=Paracoccus sp. JM45 TaxID=2283626 RepID=UPI00351A71BD